MDGSLPKRLKLTIETRSDSKTYDITETGEEIYKEEENAAHQLSKSIDRIWGERGDLKFITQTKLKSQAPDSSPNDQQSVSSTLIAYDSSKSSATPIPGAPQKDLVGEMRGTVLQRLNQACNEISIALDVVNILLAQSKPYGSSHTMGPLAPNTVNSTYIQKPKPSVRAQLEGLRLGMGGKRKQLTQAADLLLGSADSLERVVDREKRFWDETLKLRRDNWIIIGPGSYPGAPTGKFFVQYGFGFGSTFNESTFAEIIRERTIGEVGRAIENEEKIQLALPHAVRRHLRIQLVQNAYSTFSNHLNPKQQQNKVNEKRNSIVGLFGQVEEEEEVCLRDAESYDEDSMHHQLLAAQSTVFETELLQEVVKEAKGLSSSSTRISENEIAIQVDANSELILRWVKSNPSTLSPAPASTPYSYPSASCAIIKLAMQLMLRRHHRLTLAQRKKRVLQSGKLDLSKLQSPPLVFVQPLQLLRYGIFCERVRDIIRRALEPYRRLGMEVGFHFEGLPRIYSGSLEEKQEKSPVYHVIFVKLGSSRLRFTLGTSLTIFAHLPASSAPLALTNLEKFEEIVSREASVACLRLVCEVGNAVLGIPPAGVESGEEGLGEAGRARWRVEEIDERALGVITRDKEMRLVEARVVEVAGHKGDAEESELRLQFVITTPSGKKKLDIRQERGVWLKDKIFGVIRKECWDR
ncbi:uncharacterized protein VTP21DRAFT_5623 [Calcarisporiella thermophila]|uniref:uncharacterized protein n=1 Tax=Calcarisporiella thermophila TaxID=911321 RepID=UPI00374205B7